MSKLEQLIQQYCPDGVEYVPLSNIGTIKRGNGLQKKDFVESGIGCIHYGQIYTKYGTFADKTFTYVDEDLAKHLLHIEKGDLVIACTSENVEDICKAVAWLGNEVIVTGGHSCVLHHNQNPKYVAYFFQTDLFQQQKKKYAYGTKVIDIKPDNIGKIEIPVPPLPVQEEIVRILDTLTELQAELQAELQKRLQQYNYYRDNLLSFKDINRGGQIGDVEWKRLGDVCDFRNGFAFKSDLFQNNGLPIVRITNITGSGVNMEDAKYFHMEDYSKANMTLFKIQKGDILVAMSGATTGKIGSYNEDYEAYLNQRTGKFIPSNFLNNRFLYHFLLTQTNEMYRMAGGGAQPNLSSTDIKTKIIIPLPSIEEQQRIVDILDRFDSLTNDLTAGLPAEIEKRKQQYEYYRDKLLTFKRINA